MGIYWRYKQNPGGFRSLVELLEATPPLRRQKMIDAGLAEDASYTMDALKYVMDFEDVLHLPDSELAEVVGKSPARTLAFALKAVAKEDRDRILRCARPALASEVKIMMDGPVSPRDSVGAQFKLVSIARGLERLGLVKTKMIPNVA